MTKKNLSELTLEIGQRCANRCLFCSSVANRDSIVRLDKDKISSVINQALELGLERVSLSGGEPLCHPDIEEIVGKIGGRGLHLAIYTTGIIISQDGMARSFLDWKQFRSANPTLVFNLQSSVREIHDKLAGRKGAFHLTKRALMRAIQEGFRAEVHIVPNRLNIDSLERTVFELDRWGVSTVSLLRLVCQGYAKSNRSVLDFGPSSLANLTEVLVRLSTVRVPVQREMDN